MSALLAEQPLVVSLMLGLLGGALIYGWLQTGKKPAGVIGLVAIALIPLAWVLAANWVTDRERIEQVIYETADAVKQNDRERVYQVIGDPDTESRARRELPKYTFNEAKVTRIHSIELIDGSYPPEADVDMNVVANISGLRTVARRLVLKFQKLNDDWVVVDYRHMPITGTADRFSTMPAR